MVSIIVPAHNAADFLSSCLDSLLKQTYRDIEILLVDNASTDNTAEISKQYALMDSRIRALTEERKGVSFARNKALDNANGEYIAFVDADDYVEPCFIEHLVNAIQNGDADVAVCGVIEEKPNKERIRCSKYPEETFVSGEERFLLLNKTVNYGGVDGYLLNKIVKAQCLNKIRFNTNVTMCEDFLFLTSLFIKTKTLGISKTLDYHYVRRESSACGQAQKRNAYISKFVAIQEAYDIVNAEIHISDNVKTIYALRLANTIIEFCEIMAKGDNFKTFIEHRRPFMEDAAKRRLTYKKRFSVVGFYWFILCNVPFVFWLRFHN